MKNLIFLLVGGLTLFLVGCTSSKTTASQETISDDHSYPFNFVNSSSLDLVLDRAKSEGKLVFVDVYASWCLPCKMMDEDVFSHEPTANIFNQNFISYKVDAERGNGPEIADSYLVRSYPTLLFLDPQGNILEKKEGAAYHSELLSLADSARSKYPQ